MTLKIGIITPVRHIKNVFERLETIGDVVYLPDPYENELSDLWNCHILFTNPNKTKIFLGEKILNHFSRLQIIVTASTGTVHIDKDFCKERNIKIISIGRELETLERITSTAELALTGTLVACRRYIACVNDARNIDNWDYEKYVGRQILNKSVGVVGYGRLGKMYSQYMLALGANLFVYEKDCKKNVDVPCTIVDSMDEIFDICEIISLHIHADKDNLKVINDLLLSKAKTNLILVNTSRGEIIDERAVVKFLRANKDATYVSDVISDEATNRKHSPLYSQDLDERQIIISQHIGGMTQDAQEIAYNKAIDLLENHLQKVLN